MTGMNGKKWRRRYALRSSVQTVIPANAGIQWKKIWIPLFSGMTEQEEMTGD